MEIDLNDPENLKRLVMSVNHNTGETSCMLMELTTDNPDSDVEIEPDDGVSPGLGNTAAIFRRAADSESDSSSEEEEEGEKDEEEARVKKEEMEWTRGAVTPRLTPFTGKSGLQVAMPDDATPLDYFLLMVTQEIVENIVTETNRYARESLEGKQLPPSSRFRKWVDLTIQEMWSFFGLIIAMGLVVIEDIEEYWSGDEIYSLPLFRSIMTRDRFSLILSFLHLCDNNNQPSSQDPNHDPIYKIRNFVTQLTNNFQKTFIPGENIAVDEVMVAWRGPLSFRAYNPLKTKVGIKIYELCDSSTGYCANLEFYTGRRETSSNGATFDVVDRLIQPYLGCGRTLYVDNYYSSLNLFTHLKRNGTQACGTLRLSRNGLPKSMVPKLNKHDMGPIAITNGTLNLLRFFDKREVNVLTTAHDRTTVDTKKINPKTHEPIFKLKAVDDYNKFMGAVDRSAHMVAYNAFKRRTLKWWKKAFFHLFMLGVLNSYLIHKKTAAKKMTHRIFRRELAKQLLSSMSLLDQIPKSVIGLGDTSLLRLNACHFLQSVKPKPGRKQRFPQRDCVVCSEPGRRKHSRYECKSCNVGLHLEPCFKLYHTQMNFRRAYKRMQETNTTNQ